MEPQITRIYADNIYKNRGDIDTLNEYVFIKHLALFLHPFDSSPIPTANFQRFL
jgi:hypothetical protein